MAILGLVIGVVFGVLSGLLFHILLLGTASFSIFSPIMPFVQPIAAAINTAVPPGPPLLWLFVYWFLFNFLVVLPFYFIGNIGYTPQALQEGWDNLHGSGTMVTDANNVFAFPRFANMQFAFGFFLGAAIATNFVIWFLITSIPLVQVLALMALLPIFVISSTISQSRVMQVLVGWTTWIMPLSWIVSGLGLLVAVYGIVTGISSHGRDIIRVDPTSGTLEIQFDFPINPQARGFSLGLFTFLNSGHAIPTSPEGFLTRSVSAHESGHTLNTGAFGGVFLLVGALDENVLRSGDAAKLSLAELYAESRAPGTRRVADLPDKLNAYVPLWSS